MGILPEGSVRLITFLTERDISLDDGYGFWVKFMVEGVLGEVGLT